MQLKYPETTSTDRIVNKCKSWCPVTQLVGSKSLRCAKRVRSDSDLSPGTGIVRGRNEGISLLGSMEVHPEQIYCTLVFVYQEEDMAEADLCSGPLLGCVAL
jgi:hypothetical protein